MSYLEECEVRRVALAEWKLERVEEFERAVTQNRLEAVSELRMETGDESEHERIWLHTNPARAYLVFADLAHMDDDAPLGVDVVAASFEAISWVVGKENVKAWPEVRGCATVLLDHRAGLTCRALRRLIEVTAKRTGESPHFLAHKCTVVLGNAAAQQYVRLERETARALRDSREAILPEENIQKSIERYRAHHERSRDRALANVETLQRARGGDLPPPIRVQVEGA